MRLYLLFIASCFLFLADSSLSQPVPDAEAKLIQIPAVAFSDRAEAAGIEGRIFVLAEIDSDGKVTKADVLAGPLWPCGSNPRKELSAVHEAVRNSVLNARFSPAVRNGMAVESRLEISVPVGRAYIEELKRIEALKKAVPVVDRAKQVTALGVMNGHAIRLPAPAYPESARSSRVSGTVTVEVKVDETGKVAKAGAISGHRVLQSASRNAACRARFTPTSVHGKPMVVGGMVTYNFVSP